MTQRARGRASAPDRRPFAPVRPLMCLVALLACSGFAIGCGSTPQVREPAAFAPVTGYLPEDVPWALVAGSLELSQEQLAAELAEISRQPGISHLFRDRIDALLGVDIFDADDLARTGLDLRGDFALFGIGVQPAFLVRIRDAQVFGRFVDGVRGANPGLTFSSHVVDGRTIESVELASVQISYTVLDESGYVLGVYHGSGEDVAALFGDVLQVTRQDAPDLGHADLFDTALAELGADATWDTVLYANTASLDAGMLERAAPERDPALALMAEAGRARFVDERNGWLEVCAEASAPLVRRMPWMIAGVEFGRPRSTQRVVVPVDEALADDLRAVMLPLDGPYDQLSTGAIIAFALQVDFAALSQVTTARTELVDCPNLAVLEGVTAVLGTGLGRTDAADVFGGLIAGALYDFDLNLSWFSQRSGALIFQARDVAAMMAGFELYFAGIGASDGGVDADGTHYYGVFNNLLGVGVVPLEGHVALVLGKIDREWLQGALGQGASLENVALVTAVPERGRIDMDGSRLSATLEQIVEQLSPIGLDTSAAEALLDALDGLSTVAWRLRIEDSRVVVDGAWERN